MLSAIILAAGSSSRMGGVNKQFLQLGGVPVLVRSVQAFLWEGKAEEILVVCRREDWDAVDGLVGHLPKVRVVPAGGETRQQSVENALRYLYPLCDRIAIHDGARPLVRPEDIGKTVAAAKETGAAVLGVMAKDTIKVVEKGRVISTPDRSGLFVTQTPQVFDLARYREALSAAKEAGATSPTTGSCSSGWAGRWPPSSGITTTSRSPRRKTCRQPRRCWRSSRRGRWRQRRKRFDGFPDSGRGMTSTGWPGGGS